MLDSSYRAFIDSRKVDDHDQRERIEDTFGALHPLIRGLLAEGKPMPARQSSLLNWVANSETFRKSKDKGIAYRVADFQEIRGNGVETISRILDYCDIPIPDRTEIAECLWRNSQEGSGIEQAFINDPARRLPDEFRIEARKLLAEYGYSGRE